jgi:dihydropteroate synthase
MMSGIAAEKIWIDPGIGFGKTLAHNLALTAAVGAFKEETGFKLLYGASRKSFIARIDPAATDAGERLGGSIAVAIRAATLGADMLRVHDVRDTVQALRVWGAVEGVRA